MNHIIESYLAELNNSTWDGYIYHYQFDSKNMNKILSSGHLIPANKSKNPKANKDYGDRAIKMKLDGSSKENSDFENAEIYWEHAYDHFYKPCLKKPYKNYGIYCTCLDLFKITDKLKFRFKFTLDDLKGDTVIQLGKNVSKINSSSDIKKVTNKFTDDKVEKIWKRPGLKFLKLPQIVNFSDSLKVNKNIVEEL
jgi:hypothetical protein